MRHPQQVTTGREIGIIQATAYNDIHHLFIPVYLHLPSTIPLFLTKTYTYFIALWKQSD